MTKEQCLNLLMLLSAMESWSFSTKERLPDYQNDMLSEAVSVLSAEVLK